MSAIISQKGAVHLLLLIFDNPKKTVKELFELSNLTKYNVDRLLNTFELANLIDKEMEGSSKKLIYLSKQGKEAISKIKEGVKIIDSIKK